MSHLAAIDGHRAPPTDISTGTVLLTLSRGRGRELRIAVRQFKGHDFIDLREWGRNELFDEWWPTKKGITFKLRELQEVIGALEAARRASS